MSSPVSAVEAIEPAERIWAYTNGRGLRVWTPMMPALAGVHEEQEYVHSDVHAALARQAEALERENAELREALASPDWYWPEDDTSSDACADGPWQIAENHDTAPGEVFGYSRGGVIETRYFGYLDPAEDADCDDNFEVDEPTREAAEAKIAAELTRRARTLLKEEANAGN